MKYVLLIIVLFILSSCTSQKQEFAALSQNTQGKAMYQNIINRNEEKNNQNVVIPEAESFMASSFTLEQNETLKPSTELEMVQKGKQVFIKIRNPKKENILSARTWLAFPPNTLQIENFQINENLFPLKAPNEFTVDETNGLIKIGVSTNKTINEEEITLGSFTVTFTKDKQVPLTCFDYSQKNTGHCVILDDQGNNILIQPEGILIQNQE